MSAATAKDIPEVERLKLWVRAGGRCELCNAYLLEDELTMLAVNLGQMAHNVGRKQSTASPRGTDPLPVEERNLAENLLLLCGAHHKVIDDKVNRGEFTVQQLRRIKYDHEEAIRYVTGLGKDAQTVILRVIGAIRGAVVDVSESDVRDAVLSHGRRYPFFSLGYRGAGIEIDLRDLPGEGTPAYWKEAERRIEDVVDRKLRDGVMRGEIKHVSVFAFGRIPLLALLGHHLDDKITVELYQKHRDPNGGWAWKSDADVAEFEVVRVRDGIGDRVALTLSVSGTVIEERLPPDIDDATVYDIHPVGQVGDRDIFSAHGSLESFTTCYHRFLSEFEAAHPGAAAIDVFPAVPVTGAIALGRGRMRDVHPKLRIHDYDHASDSYPFALEIG